MKQTKHIFVVQAQLHEALLIDSEKKSSITSATKKKSFTGFSIFESKTKPNPPQSTSPPSLEQHRAPSSTELELHTLSVNVQHPMLRVGYRAPDTGTSNNTSGRDSGFDGGSLTPLNSQGEYLTNTSGHNYDDTGILNGNLREKAILARQLKAEGIAQRPWLDTKGAESWTPRCSTATVAPRNVHVATVHAAR